MVVVVVGTLANFLLAVRQVLVGAFGHNVLDHVWWWWWGGVTIDRVIVYDSINDLFHLRYIRFLGRNDMLHSLNLLTANRGVSS